MSMTKEELRPEEGLPDDSYSEEGLAIREQDQDEERFGYTAENVRELQAVAWERGFSACQTWVTVNPHPDNPFEQ